MTDVAEGLSAEATRARAPCVDPTRACMCTCKTCKALYAVERPDQLNVEPKCHYCRDCPRGSGVVAGVKCTTCKNTFVDPRSRDLNGTLNTFETFETLNTFVCAACEFDEAPAKETVEISVAAWTSMTYPGYDFTPFFEASSIFVAAQRIAKGVVLLDPAKKTTEIRWVRVAPQPIVTYESYAPQGPPNPRNILS